MAKMAFNNLQKKYDIDKKVVFPTKNYFLAELLVVEPSSGGTYSLQRTQKLNMVAWLLTCDCNLIA